MQLNILDENRKKMNMSIGNIELSAQNPRYTTLNSLKKGELYNKITNLINKSQTKVMLDLLSNEGDFSDLKNLFDSIFDVGFKYWLEPIYLVPNPNNNKNYIVAEGNRRIMCLKLIQNNDVFKNFEDINLSNANDNEELLLSHDASENFMETRRENFKYIKKRINEIKHKHKKFDVVTKITKTDKELWTIIYSKHIAGERPGMRKWSRGKYFTDILSIFKDGLNKDNVVVNRDLREMLLREPSIMISDFRHAQFVKAVLKESWTYNVSFEDVTDKLIFEYMKDIKVSSLQYNFSLQRIKSVANQYWNISSSEFEEKYFAFEFNKNTNIIQFDENKEISYRKILHFIYIWYKKGILTTRSIKKGQKTPFANAVKRLLTNSEIDTKNEIKLETLEEADSFGFTIKKLGDIIENWEYYKKPESPIRRFKWTKKIKELSKKIENISDDGFIINEPSEIFLLLKNQFIHNEMVHTFLNAQAATLRSIIEQIFIWAVYFDDDYIGMQRNGENLDQRRITYLHSLSKGGIISHTFSSIQTQIFSSELSINRVLSKICNTEKRKEAEFIYKNKYQIRDVLNEFIHASHRIYIDDSFTDNLEKFYNWQNCVFQIINDLNSKLILKLNEEIMKKWDK